LTVEPDSVTDEGETAHVVFAGPPEQLSDTAPVNPFRAATLSEYVAFLPATLRDEGEADKLKSASRTRTLDDVLGLNSMLPL
jgi:hypothetical protein